MAPYQQSQTKMVWDHEFRPVAGFLVIASFLNASVRHYCASHLIGLAVFASGLVIRNNLLPSQRL
jgi:hypothetical protein